MNKELFLSHLNELNIEVNEEKLNKLEKFYELLIDWNNKINLTRIVEKEEVYLKHFYDSLTIVKEVDLNKIETLCDVGTGAGFPGIVLKIFYPHLKITLVDSLLKRVNYLNTIIKDLELNDIVAIHARGEDVKEKFDIVTSRAVANIEKLVVYTMHLVNKNGRLVALKGDIDKELTDDVKSYLKDFGAATASNGAVGLYHAENLTPEAVEMGTSLLEENCQEYVIDDAELERVYKSYPVMWKHPEKEGTLAFIGCPHLSKAQLNEWADKILEGLAKSGKKKVTCQTVVCTAPPVLEEFMKTEKYKKLIATGVEVTYICPLMYTSNPLTKSRCIMTCSNKLRTYSVARYYKDDELLNIIVGLDK